MLSEKKWSYRLRVMLFFLLCTVLSFAVRTCSYNREAANLALTIGDAKPLWHGNFYRNRPASASWGDMLPTPRPNFVPYTIESAMMYAYASDIAQGKGIPARDERLVYLPETAPYAQMNMALEWFLGWGWRLKNAIVPDPPPTKRQALFQDHPHMAFWMSTQLRFWASLTSGFVFLWLIVLGCPKPLALFGGLLHAVALAAVARSTGQDFVRGEFCIPLIMASMTLAYSLYRKKSIIQYILLFICSFLAFVSWDLCQMLFGIWTCCELLRFILGKPMTAERRNVWIVITLAIWLNALFVPFNVTYELIRSSLVCV